MLILSVCHSPAGILTSRPGTPRCACRRRPVDSEVIFERVHAGDVVVVGILVAPDDAAALVLLALVRLEAHGRFHVLVELGVLGTQTLNRETGAGGGLGEDVARLAWGRCVLDDLPDAPLAPCRCVCLPAGGDLVRLSFLNVLMLPFSSPARSDVPDKRTRAKAGANRIADTP